jgi:hypothetical protein
MAKKKTAKKKSTTTAPKKKKSAKRELIHTGRDKRYVRRKASSKRVMTLAARYRKIANERRRRVPSPAKAIRVIARAGKVNPGSLVECGGSSCRQATECNYVRTIHPADSADRSDFRVPAGCESYLSAAPAGTALQHPADGRHPGDSASGDALHIHDAVGIVAFLDERP